MVLTVTDSQCLKTDPLPTEEEIFAVRRRKVKLLQLTKEEGRDSHRRAQEIVQNILTPFEALRNGVELGTPPLKELESVYQGKASLSTEQSEHSALLNDIHAQMNASGLDDARLATIYKNAVDPASLFDHLTGAFAGLMLEEKIVPEEWADAQKQLVDTERLIQKESGRRGLYLDALTESVAPLNPAFDGRQMFHDKTVASGELYTSSTLFMPDRIEGIQPYLKGRPGNLVEDLPNDSSYKFAFSFITRDFHTTDHKKLRIYTDLYIVDHRMLDAMVKHGGTQMRDDLLNAFTSIAKLANHDYLHGSVVMPSLVEDSVLSCPHMNAAIKQESMKVQLSFGTEDHARLTQQQIYKTLTRRNPEIENALKQQAMDFSQHMEDWRNHMLTDGVKENEARGMTNCLARHYLERILVLTGHDLDDPFFHTPVGDGRSIAEALGSFGMRGMDDVLRIKPDSLPPKISREVYEKNLKAAGALAPLIFDMTLTNSYALVENLKSEDKVPYEGGKVRTAYVTSEYRKAFGTLADDPSLPLADINSRQAAAQQKLLARRDGIEKLQARLRLADIAGDGGLIDKVEAALAGRSDEQANSFREASANFRAAAKRAARATEDGMVKQRFDQKKEAAHANIVDDLPVAIEKVEQASVALGSGAPASDLRQALGEMKTAWQKEAQENASLYVPSKAR